MRKHRIRPKHLAEASGVARNQLYDYRRNTSSPVISTARRIVKGVRALGYPCTFNDLFPLDDNDE